MSILILVSAKSIHTLDEKFLYSYNIKQFQYFVLLQFRNKNCITNFKESSEERLQFLRV